MSNRSITIVAWKKLSRRSELIAQALGLSLWFFKDNLPYARAVLKTLRSAISQKPKIMIVQLPQGPLLLEGYFLKKLLGCKIVADVHTGFLVNTDWKGLLLNAPFVKLLPTTDLIIAHNETELGLISNKVKGKTIVVYDPWYIIANQTVKSRSVQGGYIVFPASFADDEPLEEVIESINSFNLNVKMYITGNWKRRSGIKKYASERIQFTGFLPQEEFNNLIANSAAVITGTKREYTALMSGWEAIAYGKPLVVTATQTLKDLFSGYAVFYDWKDSASIIEAIKKVLSSKPDDLAYGRLKLKTVYSVELLNVKLKELG